MESLTTFGQWVKSRRKSLGLTQDLLARQTGCSPAAIKKIEADERRPSRQVAGLLAEQLLVPAEQRAVFVQVARGELSLERLPSPRLEIPAPQPKGTVAPKGTPPWTSVFNASPASSSAQPAAPRINIPQPAAPLVGRERELEKITRLLADPTCRMLTLTGVGGTGKTRLAIEAAIQAGRDLRHIFADGVSFVFLASVVAPNLMVTAIASALEMPFSGPGDAKRQLLQLLRARKILIVLDSLEHLLEGADLFSELLQSAPGVKLLLTSREQLHLHAEWVFEVRGLPIVQSEESGAAGGQPSSAVQLFLQRARQVHLDFQADAAETAAIERICQLVQGLPLAIELAARWTRTLSCAEIAQEIERGMELLSGGRLASPQGGAGQAGAGARSNEAARHSSMRAVFDHSWALLTAEEQRVLRRLSVFRGGFRREAAAQVSGAGLPALSALIDKSLLWLAASGRYDMHDLVQKYLAARLAEDPAEEQSARRAHSRYYLTHLQKSEPALRSPRQKETLNALDEDIDNIRQAWNTAVDWVSAAEDLPDGGDLPQSFDLLCASAEPLYYYYELHQYFKEAQELFQRAANQVRARIETTKGRVTPAQQVRMEVILASLLNFQAFFNQRPGNNVEARKLFEASLDLLRPNSLSEEKRFALAFALVHLGVVDWAMGDFEHAAANMQEGLTLSRELSHTWLRSLSLGFLGGVSHDRGDYTGARRLLSEAVALCQAEGDPEIFMLMVIYYSRTLQALDELEAPRVLLEEGLKAVRETGNRWLTALGLEYLARIARASGDHRQALRLMEESIRMHRSVGDNWSLSLGLIELSRELVQSGAYHAAEQHALEALRIVSETGYTPIALEALGILAAVDARQGRTAEALILIAHILQHPASKQDTLDQAQALRAEIVASLPVEQVGAAEEDARTKPFDAFLSERFGIRQTV